MSISSEAKRNRINEVSEASEVAALVRELLSKLQYTVLPAQRHEDLDVARVLWAEVENANEGAIDEYVFVTTGDIVRAGDDEIEVLVNSAIKALEPKPSARLRLVSPRHFTGRAREEIRARIGSPNVNLDFWDNAKLVELIDRAYIEFWRVGSDAYKRFAERALSQFQTEYLLTVRSLRDRRVREFAEVLLKPRLARHSTGASGATQIETVGLENAILDQEHQVAVIVGQPGAGKSTILKMLAQQVIDASSSGSEIYPVLLRFRDLAVQSYNLERAIRSYFQSEIFDGLNIDSDSIISNDRLVLFIDALDEVAKTELKDRALEAVSEFSDAHPEVRIVCTSRPSDYLTNRTRASKMRYYETLNLTQAQASQFIARYFSESPEKGNRLIQSLRDTSLLNKLPCTPLTLALIANIYEEGSLVEIPATVSDLYGRFVGLLLGKLTARTAIGVLDANVHHDALGFLALHFHQRREQAASRDEVAGLMSAFADQRGVKRDGYALLDELTDQVGLLFLDDEERIQFKHLSFQEYFTADSYFRRDDLGEAPFVREFNDPWWQEVAIFYAGMSRHMPGMLRSVLDEAPPRSLAEHIYNAGGLGRLLQALYGTSVEIRREGLRHSLRAVLGALHIVETSDDPRLSWVQSFSRYTWISVLRAWYSHNHRSITLAEPMEYVVHELLSELGQAELSPEAAFQVEYQLFMIASTLADPGLRRVGPLRGLALYSRTTDLSLLAAEASFAEEELEGEFIDASTEKEIRKVRRRIIERARRLGDIEAVVNAPIRPQGNEAPQLN